MTPQEETIAHLTEEISKVSCCGSAVWDCPSEKQLIQVENRFQPHIHGKWQFKPQCLKCGRIGKAQKEYVQRYGPPISEAQAKNYEKARKELRDRLYAELRTAHDQRVIDEKAEWRQRYQEHLSSEYWADIRKKVLERDKWLCQSCLTEKAADVHHLTYKHLGNEPAFDLISVCRACHMAIHGEHPETLPF